MDALGNIDWEANFKEMTSEEKLDFIYSKCHEESVSYVPEKTLAQEIKSSRSQRARKALANRKRCIVKRLITVKSPAARDKVRAEMIDIEKT